MLLAAAMIAFSGGCGAKVVEREYSAKARGLFGDSAQVRVRVSVDQTSGQVTYLQLAPLREIQTYGKGGTFNPEIVASECRIYDTQNWTCTNFNRLLKTTVARLDMTDGSLRERTAMGDEIVYQSRLLVFGRELPR